ncbi:MAG: glycosyl transferase family 2 [Planctomycetota bacterium]|nr:MAG: glycosyl transferase family 2 [Planctomycetota bacterium]
MLSGKTIGVVIPCYNEETQISYVIESMPAFVDRIVVINDHSKDKTLNTILEIQKIYNLESILPVVEKTKNGSSRFSYADDMALKMIEEEDKKHIPSEIHEINNKIKLIIIDHKKNGGVGGSIASGYKWCRDHDIDCTAVMAGDGQMDPAELESICMPIVNEEVDYVKGNRLIHRAARRVIPWKRFFGNSVLSILTKIASGYWHISDTQTGYTAINLVALQSISLSSIYRSYGMPNDMLVKLNIGSFIIKEVPIKPVYNIGEKSKMKIPIVIPKISFLLIKLFLKRLVVKYFLNDFHPLFLCYLMFIFCLGLDIAIFANLIYILQTEEIFRDNYFLLGSLMTMLTTLFLLFGMWFDMQDNERLQK